MLACGQVLGLGTHIFDLGQLQGTVFSGFGQHLAGDVGVDVDLELLVALANDQAVAHGAQIGAELIQGHGLGSAADNKYGIVGKGDVLQAQPGEVGPLLLLGQVGPLRHGFALHLIQHSLENDQKSLAAGIDDPSLFEDGILLGGVLQSLPPSLQGLFQHHLHRVVLPGGGSGGSGSKPGHGKDGALSRLHHRFVGGGNAKVQCDGKVPAINGLLLLHRLGKAPEQ